MTLPPARPRIYHITHVSNLAAIVATDGLLSDARIIACGGPKTTIGMSTIKRRRLEAIEVYCHPNTMVGDYVPFYFCPRSIMLYVIHMGNHQELTYRGGQDPIVHLEYDLDEVIRWAEEQNTPWAFSLSNAGAYAVKFRNERRQLNEINWDAMSANDWRSSSVREAKQAEFLVYGFCPWALVRRIGVRRAPIAHRVSQALQGTAHRPPCAVLPGWYY